MGDSAKSALGCGMILLIPLGILVCLNPIFLTGAVISLILFPGAYYLIDKVGKS